MGAVVSNFRMGAVVSNFRMGASIRANVRRGKNAASDVRSANFATPRGTLLRLAALSVSPGLPEALPSVALGCILLQLAALRPLVSITNSQLLFASRKRIVTDSLISQSSSIVSPALSMSRHDRVCA